MNEIFLKIINMSISASWLILIVIVIRLVFSKVPKWINVLLWGIVAIRLIFPFTIESSFSLLPESIGSGEIVSKWLDDYIGDVDIHHPTSVSYDAAINAGREPIADGEGGYYVVTKHNQLSEPSTIENTLIPVLSTNWTSGMILISLYTAISYLRLHSKLDTAVLYKDNIYQSESVSSPFVLGLIKPRIYLPFKEDGKSFDYVIAHEKAHIQRKDHLWKALGFLILIIHWFNPLVWLAYALLCSDIELACDEKVIKELDNTQRANYAQVLLAYSVNHHTISACPLAFGEVDVKERVRSIMNYKKPTFWLAILAIIACVGVATCFLTNPKQDKFRIKIVVPAKSQEEFVYSDEEISTIKNSIKIWSTEGLGDTEVVLYPVNKSTENKYTPTYLTSGMPVKFNAQKDTWFKVGVNIQNPTDKDMIVYVEVENVEVRISDKITTFKAEILEISNGYLLVKPMDTWVLNSADQIEAPVKDLDKSREIKVGDIVEITFDGEILETYPAFISEVYSISVIKSESGSIDILKIFQENISNDENIMITDYVYADDKAYGLDGVIQYTDESGSPWKLAFIRDGVVHLVSQDWGTNYIIDSDLKYLGNGIAEVNIKDINDGTVYQCCLEYSYDTKENHTNYKSTSNIITN